MTQNRQLAIALQSDKHLAEYAGLARAVEDFGFDVLSIYSDLMYQPPLGPLTAAALATSRIRLGPASLNPYTLHPVEMAGQVATLDLASQGRAYWGVSRGAWLQAIGIEQQRPVTRVREAIDVVEHLLSGRTEAYCGSIFRIDANTSLRYKVQRAHVPLLIGSWGPKLLKTAGQRAAEVKIGGSTNPDLVPVIAQRLGEGSSCGIVMGAVTIVDEDRDVARAAIRTEMALYLPVVAQLDPTVEIDPELIERMDALVTAGDQQAAGKLIPEDLLSRFSFAGNPFDIIEQCEALFESGATRIEFGTPHGVSGNNGIDLLGRLVLPELRKGAQSGG